MAAIIAQMTRANRERKKKKRVEISKCMYDLPPYPDHFDEQLHNKYLRARLMVHDKKMAEKFHRVVLERLEAIAAEEERNRAFRFSACCFECLVIVVSLALVPSLILGICIFWPDTPTVSSQHFSFNPSQ